MLMRIRIRISVVSRRDADVGNNFNVKLKTNGIFSIYMATAVAVKCVDCV